MRPESKQLLERRAAVFEVRSWIGTPYILGARLKGAGCDCVTFIAEAAINCRMVERAIVDDFFSEYTYHHDWWAHASDDLYLLRLLRHATKMLEGRVFHALQAKPASLILTRVCDSKFYNHGAVVTEWPKAVHAVSPMVQEIDVTLHHMWAGNEVVILDGWSG